jgi:hypothetical protein
VNFLPALIICPKSALPSWRKDAKAVLTGVKVTVASSQGQLVSALKKLVPRTPHIIVTSKDTFEGVDPGAELPEHVKKLRTILMDESQYAKNSETNLAQAVLRVAAVTPNVILMSGTPVMNAVSELATQMFLVEPREVLQRKLYGGGFKSKDEEQRDFLQRMVPTARNFKRQSNQDLSYVAWDTPTISQVTEYVRSRGVRRARRTVVPYLSENKKLKEKKRQFKFVAVAQDKLRLSVDEFLTRIRSGSVEAKEYRERMDNFRRFREQTDQSLNPVYQEARKLYPQGANHPDYTQAVRRLSREVQKLLFRGHLPVSTEVRTALAKATVGAAVAEHREKLKAVADPEKYRPSIVFAYNVRVRDALTKQFKAAGVPTFHADGSDAVYYGDRPIEDLVWEQAVVDRRGRPTGKIEQIRVAPAFEGLSQLFSRPGAMVGDRRKAVIILTSAGAEGLNLAGADTVIFTQRLRSPGAEFQAEDRVNRPEQTVSPNIVYLIGAEPISLIYANRVEKKRNDLFRAFGESPTDDYSTPLDLRGLRAARTTARKQIEKLNLSSTDAQAVSAQFAMFLAELGPRRFAEEVLSSRLKQMASEDRGPTKKELLDRKMAEDAKRRAAEQAARAKAQAEADKRRQAMGVSTLEDLAEAVGYGSPKQWSAHGVNSAVTTLRNAKKVTPRLRENNLTSGRLDSILADKKEHVFFNFPLGFIRVREVGVQDGRVMDIIQKLDEEYLIPREEWSALMLRKQTYGYLGLASRIPLEPWEEAQDFLEDRGVEVELFRPNPQALGPFEPKPVDVSEEQIRRIRLSLFQRFITEGYSKNKAIRVEGRVYGPGERLSPPDAKNLAFRAGGRRQGSRFLREKTNIPTELSKWRAEEKRADPEALDKRKQYEDMLGIGRRSGPYRVTVEPSYKTGRTVFYIWPMGKEYRTEAAARRAWGRLK